ncbi:beta-lactamase [Stackebrandtia albiflava]|uniref:Beta-lactamase n=1 Tax=Stackebrandtia albiflava TaxID=406432 RepID=A0A562UPJ4_9ACTN|nr:serine hydrolase domain-containing protein [Stackebrandtia albiflava]TWJ07516.1 beta-lactamase [Stackebrandtia albiflava]
MDTPAPVVPVYSVAKTYTAAAAFLTLDLAAPVSAYLPDPPPPVAGLRLHDLLTHRSGLDDYSGWPDYRAAVAARETPWPPETVLSRARTSPAGGFRYSNIGYLLVRRCLEEAHGDTLFGVLDTTVLSPLGITAHRFAEPADWTACTHPSTTGHLRAYHPGWVYPGTFAARVDDTARGIALMMRGALGDDLAAAMRDTAPVDAPGHPLDPPGYGLGLMTGGTPPVVVGHGGGGPGFHLFAAATADGRRWHGVVTTEDTDPLDPAATCVAAVASARPGS